MENLDRNVKHIIKQFPELNTTQPNPTYIIIFIQYIIIICECICENRLAVYRFNPVESGMVFVYILVLHMCHTLLRKLRIVYILM